MSADALTSDIMCRRLSGHIGAEIWGIDIGRPLAPQVVMNVRDLLLAHKVVFFRGQGLDHVRHITFARQFGEPTGPHVHDDAPLPDFPEIHTIDVERDRIKYGRDFGRTLRRRQSSTITGWHTDLTPTVNPPMGSILRADLVPEYGGDTQWTNLESAFDDLSPALQEFVSGLRAVHRYRTLPARPGSQLTRTKNAETYLAEHPVVRVHPETGRRSLFVNPSFTSHIVGMSVLESRTILDLLFAQVTRPEFTVRFRWNAGDVAFWDNRSTAHLAPTDLDLGDVVRRMYRVTLMGDRPVGVDGRASELVSGRPLTGSGWPTPTE